MRCGFVLGSSLKPVSQNISTSDYTGINVMQRNFYVCASAIRASIKTVTFRYNGTGSSLENLKVLEAKDKEYPDENSYPLWASEHSYNKVMRFDPLWGLVSSDAPAAFNGTPIPINSYASGIYTHRSPKIWLPTSPNLATNFGTASSDSVAAVSAFMRQLGNLYGGLEQLGAPDYTGNFDFAMLERFQRLSGTAELVSNIPSLIMTDAFAAQLVGTKTATSRKYVAWPASLAVDDEPAEGTVPLAQVRVYKRVIKYDLRYAIPGFVVLAILMLFFIWALAILIGSKGGIVRVLRDLYNQTSTGRLATNLLLRDGHGDSRQSTKRWVKGEGGLHLRFGHLYGSPSAVDRVDGTVRSPQPYHQQQQQQQQPYHQQHQHQQQYQYQQEQEKEPFCAIVDGHSGHHQNGYARAEGGAAQTLMMSPK